MKIRPHLQTTLVESIPPKFELHFPRHFWPGDLLRSTHAICVYSEPLELFLLVPLVALPPRFQTDFFLRHRVSALCIYLIISGHFQFYCSVLSPCFFSGPRLSTTDVFLYLFVIYELLYDISLMFTFCLIQSGYRNQQFKFVNWSMCCTPTSAAPCKTSPPDFIYYYYQLFIKYSNFLLHFINFFA